MATFEPHLYSKIILLGETKITDLTMASLSVEIDKAYTIGKSIAVLHDGTVLGHMDRLSSRVVWRHLSSGTNLTAEVYPRIGSWENGTWYSAMTRSFEVGIRINFCNLTREDGKLLLAHIAKNRLNSFPGIAPSNCPDELKQLLRPIKDENGVSPLLFLACHE